MARTRQRQWQAVVTWPSGATMTFGIKAKDQDRARSKAAGLLTRLPPGQLRLTRVYWHKMRPRAVSRRQVPSRSR
jgi:hypothetical protein